MYYMKEKTFVENAIDLKIYLEKTKNDLKYHKDILIRHFKLKYEEDTENMYQTIFNKIEEILQIHQSLKDLENKSLKSTLTTKINILRKEISFLTSFRAILLIRETWNMWSDEKNQATKSVSYLDIYLLKLKNLLSENKELLSNISTLYKLIIRPFKAFVGFTFDTIKNFLKRFIQRPKESFEFFVSYLIVGIVLFFIILFTTVAIYSQKILGVFNAINV